MKNKISFFKKEEEKLFIRGFTKDSRWERGEPLDLEKKNEKKMKTEKKNFFFLTLKIKNFLKKKSCFFQK